MSAVSAQTAIERSEELIALYLEQQDSFVPLESSIAQCCEDLDRLNDQQRQAASYPLIEELEASHLGFTQRIEGLEKQVCEVEALGKQLARGVAVLEKIQLSPKVLSLLKELNAEIGASAEAEYTKFQDKIAQLSGYLQKVQTVSARAFRALQHIRAHPLACLQQTIQRVDMGYKSSNSVLGVSVTGAVDRVARYAASLPVVRQLLAGVLNFAQEKPPAPGSAKGAERKGQE